MLGVRVGDGVGVGAGAGGGASWASACGAASVIAAAQTKPRIDCLPACTRQKLSREGEHRLHMRLLPGEPPYPRGEPEKM